MDPSGHWIDMIIDAIGFAVDAYNFVKDPSLENAIYMVADLACLVVPVATSSGILRATLKKGGKKAASASVVKSSKITTKNLKAAGKNYLQDTVEKSNKESW